NRTYRFAALKGADVAASVDEPEPRAFVRSARNGRSGATAAATPPSVEALPQTETERREAARAARARREEQIRTAAIAQGIDPSYDLLAAPASDVARHGDARLQR